MKNHFILDPSDYQRDLNIFKHGYLDYAFFIHKHTRKEFDTCLQWVKQRLALGQEGGLLNPRVKVLERNKTQDRTLEIKHLDQLLCNIEKERLGVSPALATYLHPGEKESIPKLYLQEKKKQRKLTKAEMFDAIRRGDTVLTEYKNNEQNAYKIKMNSASGAMASSGTVLNNMSGHPTLTSTCATITSYGNANNEKFLAGNRHYWSMEVVKANIASICRTADYDAIEQAMTQFGIRHPSVEETMGCIERSAHQYGHNTQEMAQVYRFVTCLSDIERSAFVYTGDLYHLAQCNDEVVRTFLTRLSQLTPYPIDDPETYLQSADKDLLIYCSVLAPQLLKLPDADGKVINVSIADLKHRDYERYRLMGSIAYQAITVLDEYQSLIRGFWRPNTVPASIAAIKHSIRHTAVVSDTDSSIFTVQNWVEWYSGQTDFSDQSNRLAQAMVYLSSQTIIHVLAILSAGMGVIPEMIHDLSMKNEYTFPVFVNTSNGKHYFAYQSVKEGVVFDDYEVEIKGVNLKDSNVPKVVMDQFKDFLRYVMDSVLEGNPLSIYDIYHRVGAVEQQVEQGARKGHSTYFKTVGINEESSYTKPESSNYAYHAIWNEVFGPKYGQAPTPPYVTIKVNLNRKSKTAVTQWLESIEDKALADRLHQSLSDRGRSANVTQLLLPKDIVDSYGIPDEIAAGVDFRAIVMATVKPYYLVLESLGIYMTNKNMTRMVSDYLKEGMTPMDVW